VIPRRLVPGQTHAVTRRVRDRTFLLRPDPTVNAIVLYALGVALSRRSVDLYAAMVESNHVHTNTGDGGSPSALPDFYRDFHSLTARGLNAHYGRGENLWRTGSYENVEVHGQRTLEEQFLYTWTNPVKDGLVERPEDWPGVKFLPEDFGRTFTVERPEGAFFGGRRPADWQPTFPPARAESRRAESRAREEERRQARLSRIRPGARPPKTRAPRPDAPKRRSRRTLPDRVTFTIAPPPGYEHMSIEEVRAHFRALLDARVALIHEQRRAAGFGRFLGVAAVLAQEPRARAGDTFPTFARNPRIACLAVEARVGLLTGLREWRAAYRVAFEAWTRGDRTVVFPCGSYALPRWHAARVRPATGPPLVA
jgi:hypothetical protein